MQSPNRRNRSVRMLSGLAGTVVLFGVAGCASNDTASSLATQSGGEPIVVNEPIAVDSPSVQASAEPDLWIGADADLDIDDQRGDGDFVVIESVDSPYAKSFVVITNTSGQVLGVGLSTPDRQIVSIPLNPKVTTTSKLIGTLYADDGDGEFSPESDELVFDDDNEIVSEDFDYVVLNSDRAASNNP